MLHDAWIRNFRCNSAAAEDKSAYDLQRNNVPKKFVSAGKLWNTSVFAGLALSTKKHVIIRRSPVRIRDWPADYFEGSRHAALRCFRAFFYNHHLSGLFPVFQEPA